MKFESIKDLKDHIKKRVGEQTRQYIDNVIVPDLVKIFQNRVPIDSEFLKSQIKGKSRKQGNAYAVKLYIQDSKHPNGGINTNLLGLILNVGLREKKNGNIIELKRSKSQPQNPAGSPTEDWWQQAISDCYIYAKAKGL